jgi:hypothetical protein
LRAWVTSRGRRRREEDIEFGPECAGGVEYLADGDRVAMVNAPDGAPSDPVEPDTDFSTA